MKKIITSVLISVGVIILIASCGQRVNLNYKDLESQYIELTPYWELVSSGQEDLIKDKTAAISFSRYYREARDIINYYNKPGRDIGPGGSFRDAPTDEELLWKLRSALNNASSKTNSIVSGK